MSASPRGQLRLHNFLRNPSRCSNGRTRRCAHLQVLTSFHPIEKKRILYFKVPKKQFRKQFVIKIYLGSTALFCWLAYVIMESFNDASNNC